MRQAIETRYLGPTNFRGARVKASAQAGSVTIAWDHALSVNDNHDAAARALCKRFGWAPYDLFGGGKANGSGNVYVWNDHKVTP